MKMSIIFSYSDITKNFCPIKSAVEIAEYLTIYEIESLFQINPRSNK